MIKLIIVFLAIAIVATAIATTPTPAQLMSPFGKDATPRLSSDNLTLISKAMRDSREETRRHHA
jgi:hypothetical protein